METIGNFILVTLIWILVEVNCQGSISLDGVHVDPYALSEEERLLEYELQMKENRIHSKQFPKICHGIIDRFFSKLNYFKKLQLFI